MQSEELDSSPVKWPYSDEVKDAVCSALWGTANIEPRIVGPSLNIYWLYYKNECVHALHDGGRHVAARSHRDIVVTAQKLRNGDSCDNIKNSLRAKLTKTHANEDDMLQNSINLSARLLTMIELGNHPYSFSGRTQLQWRAGTLREFVASYFAEASLLSPVNVKLERIFVARNLVRMAGLKIAWTDNIVDHLRLTDDDTTVHIFHHASFLDRQQQSNDSLLPPDVIDETMRTLALLFPSTDRHTKKWLLEQSASAQVDPAVGRCGTLKTDSRQIDKFRIWRDRLVVLKQVFDDPTRKNIWRLWRDRRNGLQWYTFWAAVLVLALTVFFGLVQSIEGALQVYVAFAGLGQQPTLPTGIQQLPSVH